MANFQDLAPYFGAVGQSLIDLDADKLGADDFAGSLLIYVAEVVQAVGEGADLPTFPDELKAGTTDRVSGAFKAVLIVTNSLLTVARFQVRGKAAVILKYVTQTISQLISGNPVPPAPATVVK